MNHRLLGCLALFAALTLVDPVKATDTPPPTAADVDLARANAQTLLAKQGVTDIFENITDGAQPKVRHRASGMTCTARGEKPEITILVYPGSPRGEDVSCGVNVQTVVETMYATRYNPPVSAQQVVLDSVPAIRSQFTEVTPYQGDYASYDVAGADRPSPVTVRFTARFHGRQVFTRSSAVAIGGWILAQRVTAPLENAVMADAIAEMSLQLEISDMMAPGSGI